MITSFLLVLFLRPLHSDWSSNQKYIVFIFISYHQWPVTLSMEESTSVMFLRSTVSLSAICPHLFDLWCLSWFLHILCIYFSADCKVTLTLTQLTHFIFMTFSFSTVFVCESKAFSVEGCYWKTKLTLFPPVCLVAVTFVSTLNMHVCIWIVLSCCTGSQSSSLNLYSWGGKWLEGMQRGQTGHVFPPLSVLCRACLSHTES